MTRFLTRTSWASADRAPGRGRGAFAGRASRRAPGLLLATLLCALAQHTAAQESGTTEVTVSFDGNQFQIVMLVDPDSILTKLDRRGGRLVTRTTSLAKATDRIVAHRDELLRHIVVQFDDRVGQPRLEAVVPASPDSPADQMRTAPRVAIRLSGQIPAGSRRFSWSYGLSYATYALTIRQGTSITRTMVEGGQATSPFDLVPRRTTFGRAGLWGGVVLGVFVVLLTTRGAEYRKRMRATA